MTQDDPSVELTSLCWCVCKDLNCVTLLMIESGGAHRHYRHLPCPNQIPEKEESQ